MKDSGIEWIGEIPKGWGLERAKFLFRQSTSKGNERLVLLSATQDRGVIDKSNLEGVVQVSANADLNLFKTVHINDFVISLRSFQGGFEIAKEEGVISPAYTVFRLTQQTYPHFYRYLFKCNSFIDKINSLTVGIREGKNIQYEDFANMLIPQIDEAEQQSIANHLDTKCAEIDNLISLQEEMIAELKAYKQSVITEAVCKGLDKNVPMKDSGVEWIGEIPEHWEIRKVTHIYENIGSGTTPKSSNESYYVDEGYSFLQTGDLNDGIIERTSKYLSEKALKECSLKTYPKGGLVIAMYGATIGKLGILNIDTVTNQACCVLSGNSVYDKMFSFYVFFADRPNLIMQANGGGQPNISQDIIKRDKLPVPPLTEQQTIANYLDKKCANIDQLISIKQQKADELKEYKKSMIYEYVTGKKEVI